jgi:hypothetical protein
MTAPLQADEIAAMRTAVDHGVDLAIEAAGDHDRGFAEKGRREITGLRDVACEREKLPSRSEKDPGELLAIDLRVGEHPVGHARIALGRPFERRLVELLLHGGSLVTEWRSRWTGGRPARS